MKNSVDIYAGLLLLCMILIPHSVLGDESDYTLNLYGAILTENNFDDFLQMDEGIDTMDSRFLAVALAKSLGPRNDDLNFEVEGQLVKHFGLQDHWEINGLATMRWENFFWDRHLDTSAAFGLGASYASDIPEAEVRIEGESKRWMAYWMIEFAFALPRCDNVFLITRVHHRSEAFGLIADKGGSNALAIGLKIPLSR